VLVSDIYAEAAEYLGTNDQTHVFRTLTRAVEYLANKGDWDVLKGYVDLPVQGVGTNARNLVVLPWQVDVPLKFTINDFPAFSRDRLYEFTLNGFGSNPANTDDRQEYGWEDRGFVPYSVLPPKIDIPFHVLLEPIASVDAGKKVYLRGQGTDGIIEVKETLTLSSTGYVQSLYPYSKLTEVNKDVTLHGVFMRSTLASGGAAASILDLPPDIPDIPEIPDLPDLLPPELPDAPAGSHRIAFYFPQETNPRYRLIRLSVDGAYARFLFRRKVFKILSMYDFIPVQSELGLLTMVQAIQALRRKDLETAKALADAAVEITTDAQRATTGFIELANNTEIQESRNYQIYNRDSVIMLDIYDDIAKILGNVGQFQIFDATTTGLEILCNKGHYDGLTGYVDIQTDGWRYATLPRFVDQPVAIAINGRPAYMRNKWSEFHLNGPGSDEYGGQYMGGAQFGSWYGFSGSGRWGQIHAWDSVGEVVTIKPLQAVSQLVAVPDNIDDDLKTMRIYGYDETGKWIIGADGEDGYSIRVSHNKLLPNINTDQKVARIERITRQATAGFVRLIAYDAVQQTTSVLLGYYYPDETEPRYFRLKLPTDAQWIRLRYRKRTLKVTSVWQPLHLHSRMAIVTMVRSMKLLDTDAASAQVMEDKAMKFLDDDQKARNPGEAFQLEINEDTGWNSNFIVS
jgi:hypothetical protein